MAQLFFLPSIHKASRKTLIYANATDRYSIVPSCCCQPKKKHVLETFCGRTDLSSSFPRINLPELSATERRKMADGILMMSEKIQIYDLLI